MKTKSATSQSVKVKAKPSLNGTHSRRLSVGEICERLQSLQRQRAIVMKSRIMQTNRLQAVIAGTLGYSPQLSKKEREEKFREAAALIDRVVEGTEDHLLKVVIMATLEGVTSFNEVQALLEKDMVALAEQLPVARWVDHPNQRGFGLKSLATVIGETGDLFKYANPAKLWRRMGCAPWSFTDASGETRTLMGATWRSLSKTREKLPSEEWEKFGYSPRRRSIAYILGTNLVKLNGPDSAKVIERKTADGKTPRTISGPYAQEIDRAKAAAAIRHPDWSDGHCHNHGMLLATKLLLLNLWREWHGKAT